MIDVMKQALEALTFRVSPDKELEAIAALRQAIEQAEKDDMYRNPDTGNPCEGWNTSDMAHRSGGLSVEQEPVAYKYADKHNPLVFYFTTHKNSLPHPDVIETALYTAPPKCEIEQEPVGKVIQALQPTGWTGKVMMQKIVQFDQTLPVGTKLYTAPPKREWIGLTEEEVGKYSDRLNGGDIAREVETKLKERNT
jgi:hypothetical protein